MQVRQVLLPILRKGNQYVVKFKDYAKVKYSLPVANILATSSYVQRTSD